MPSLIAIEGKERAPCLAHPLQVAGRIPEVTLNQTRRTHDSQALAKEGWAAPRQTRSIIVAGIMHQPAAGRRNHQLEVPHDSITALDHYRHTGGAAGKEARSIQDRGG